MFQSDDISSSTSNEVIPEYNSDDTDQDEHIYVDIKKCEQIIHFVGKIIQFWSRNK